MGIRRHVRNLQQGTAAAFYLFGLVLFLGLQDAYRTIEDGPTPVSQLVVRNFQIHFAFAANVFFVLLVVHLLQWVIVKKVELLGLRAD